jgi:hypothetical protein
VGVDKIMKKIKVGQKVLIECEVVTVVQGTGRVYLACNGFTFETMSSECRSVKPEPVDSKSNARPSTLDKPYALARQWFELEEINRRLNIAGQRRQQGGSNPAPVDVYTAEFIAWLAKEYAIAMANPLAEIEKRGLETKVEQLQERNQARIKAIAKEIVAEFKRTEV